MKNVDKSGPTIFGATAAQRKAADNQMQIYRNENDNSHGLKGLAPNSLKQCAYKRVLEHPKSTWEEITIHLVNKDLCFAMSTDGQEISSSNHKMVSIEKQLRKLKEALQSHSVKAVNLNPQSLRMNQNFTRFCELCHTEGHTVMYCPKKRNQSIFENKTSIAHNKITLENIPTEFFVRFKGIKINFITDILDHNKTHSKLGIVSLKPEKVPEITFKISEATVPKTQNDKMTQSNQNYSNQLNTEHLLFQNPNNEANQNNPSIVHYINEQDVTEEINMIRQHPITNVLQIQINNGLTYQSFRTGCTALLKYIKIDLFHSTESLAHCVSADFATRKCIAAELVEKFPTLRSSALHFSYQPGAVFAYWHGKTRCFFYKMVTKVKCIDEPNPSDVANAIEAMREHALRNDVKVIAMPRLANGLDGLPGM